MNERADTPPPDDPGRFDLPRRYDLITVVVLIVLGGMFALGTMGELHSNYRAKRQVDFTMYHAAAQAAAKRQDLYTFHEKARVLPYPYPPTLASLLYPLGLLDRQVANYIWCVLLMFGLGFLAFLTARILTELGGPRPLLLALGGVVLCVYLLDSNLFWGQVNIPVNILVAASVLYGLRGRSATAGALLGAAAAIKVLPVLLLLWFLVRRDWRAIGAAVATALGCLLIIPAAVGGLGWAWDSNMGWLKLFWAALTKGSQGLQTGGGYVSHLKNASVVAVFDRIFGGAGRKAMWFSLPQPTINLMVNTLRLTFLLGSIAAVVRLFRPRARAVEPYLWPLAASLLLMCGWLINILLWDHHTIGFAMVAPVLAAACADRRLPARWRYPLWVALISLIMVLASGYYPGARRAGVQTVCYAVTWGGVAWALFTAPPREPEPPPPPPEPEQLYLEGLGPESQTSP